jgi:hypothetical protein
MASGCGIPLEEATSLEKAFFPRNAWQRSTPDVSSLHDQVIVALHQVEMVPIICRRKGFGIAIYLFHSTHH